MMKTLLAFLLLEAVTDLSSCVLLILCLSYAGLRRTNTAQLNRILLSLNVSNMFFTIFLLAYFFTSSLWSHFYQVTFVFYFISYMTLYSITSSSWLTATLCFFYFMKIIPSQPGILRNIKNQIGAIAWRLIVMAETVSVGGSLLSMLTSPHDLKKRNSTMEESRRESLKLSNLVLILNCLPFIVIIVTTVTSAWLLKVYNHQMKSTGTLVNTNVKDYRSAVQTMTGLLIFYLFLILAIVILALEIFVDSSGGFWICVVALLSFPTGQSIFLIYSNPKLKHIFKKLFTKLTCRVSWSMSRPPF